MHLKSEDIRQKENGDDAHVLGNKKEIQELALIKKYLQHRVVDILQRVEERVQHGRHCHDRQERNQNVVEVNH